MDASAWMPSGDAAVPEGGPAEERIRSIWKLYATLSQTHQAMLRIHDEPALLQQLCEIAAEFGELALAWVGLEQPEAGLLRVAACAGPARGYLEGVVPGTGADSPFASGPALTALRRGLPVVVDDYQADPATATWRERAERWRIAASAAFPIRRGGRVVGTLNVYSERARCFDQEKVALLSEIADSLSFALDALAREAELGAAQRQVASTAQRLLLATGSAGIGIWELDVPSDTQVWDDRMFELFGVARAEFPGGVAGWAGRLHPEDRARVLEAQERALAGTGCYDLEYRILLPDGGVRHLKATAQVIRDGAGRPLRMIGSNRDVTAGNLAEQALRQSRERFHRLFEEALEGIAVADVGRGVLVDCNRAFQHLTGYGREELIGAPIARLHPEACLAPLMAALRTVLAADGGGRTIETRIRTRAGAEREIRIRVNPVILGEHRYAQGLFIDLTESRRQEREREATLELLRLLNQPSLTHELIALVARFLQDWTGCEAVGIRLRDGDDFPYFETRGFPDDFVRRETSLCVRDGGGQVARDPDGNALLECMCGNVLCGRADGRLPCFTGNGSFWTNSTTDLLASSSEADLQGRTRNRCNGEGYESVALIPLRSGELTLGLLQVNDPARDRFTPELIQFLERTGHQLGLALAQRQAQAEVRHLNEELELQVERRTAQFESANRELEAFSYSVSHDLRAPLRAIDGFSQVLLEDYGERLDDDGRRYLERVRLGTQRMGHLIEDLLKLSRLSRGELELGPLDLSAQAERILRDLALRDPGRTVATEVLPGLRATGDARLMTIALENLLGNAWKYTSRTAAARIEVGLRFEEGQPAFFVKDNGAGFDMAYAGKLFSPFQRLHAAPEFEGSGIGLALVQRILNRHGGRVWAEARPDLGATFLFTLP